MKYVLIWVIMFSWKAVTSGSHEFNNQEECEKAAQELKSVLKSKTDASIICAPKGKEK